MRVCVALALVAAMFASSAAIAAEGSGKEGAKKAAKGKRGKKGKKGKKSEPEGPNMDSNDPVYRETSEKGRFAPQGVTGELKAKEEAVKVEARVETPYVPPPRDRFVVFADMALGFGRAPKPGPDVQGETTDATTFSFVAGARYDFLPEFSAGVRIPWSTASMDRPDLRTEQDMAFGSPQILAEYRVELSRVTTLPIILGVGLPLAQGNWDPNSDLIDRRKGEVNLHADASRGYQDGELFAPYRLPVVVGAGIDLRGPSLNAHGYTKFVLGVDTGTELRPDNDDLEGTLVVESMALRNVTLAGFTYRLIEEIDFWAGLDAWFAYNFIEPLEYESDAVDQPRLQFVPEVRTGASFGKLRPSLGFLFPIGGRLQEADARAVRLRVDYAF